MEYAEQGEYFAVGVKGAVTGRGADLVIIDDPHSEQEEQATRPPLLILLTSGILLDHDNVCNLVVVLLLS